MGRSFLWVESMKEILPTAGVVVRIPIGTYANVADIEEAFAAIQLTEVSIPGSTTVQVSLKTSPILTDVDDLTVTCDTQEFIAATTADQNFVLKAVRGATTEPPMGVLLLHFKLATGSASSFVVRANLLTKGNA